MNFAELCNSVQTSRRLAIAEQEREPIGEVINGVSVQLKPFYSDRRHDRREVLLDGYNFACELEYVPWNVFKAITVTYWIWLDIPDFHKVEDLIREARMTGKVEPLEDFYPPEDAPARWNACAKELTHVVSMWKVWAPKYKPE